MEKVESLATLVVSPLMPCVWRWARRRPMSDKICDVRAHETTVSPGTIRIRTHSSHELRLTLVLIPPFAARALSLRSLLQAPRHASPRRIEKDDDQAPASCACRPCCPGADVCSCFQRLPRAESRASSLHRTAPPCSRLR